MSVVQLREGLKVTLSTIPGIKRVHKYEPKAYVELPAASIFFDGFDQGDNSTTSNQLTYRFTVLASVRLQDADKAQEELDILIDSIIDIVAKTSDLGVTGCYGAMATSGETVVVQNQQNPQLAGELVITVNKLINRR